MEFIYKKKKDNGSVADIFMAKRYDEFLIA